MSNHLANDELWKIIKASSLRLTISSRSRLHDRNNRTHASNAPAYPPSAQIRRMQVKRFWIC
ncbi:MAG: hypothetical protein JWQ98_1055 [Chlorobi bacterium]|nr:hypothetical protein [Chlorobiota bacterium]